MLKKVFQKVSFALKVLGRVDGLYYLAVNQPEIDIRPLVDPESGRKFDYPDKSKRVKLLVAEALSSAADYVNSTRVEGHIAEFGVGSGWTAAVLVRAMRGRSARRFHLFDSFEGLPQATSEVDLATPMVKDGIWGAGTCNWKMTPEVLTRSLAPFLDKLEVSIYPGWFSKTIPDVPAGTKFALVHIDCDLYQSTVEVLDGLFGRRMLTPGAILLFDDWCCNACSPELGQQKAWREMVAKYDVQYMDYGFYSYAGKKMIIQGFRGLS